MPLHRWTIEPSGVEPNRQVGLLAMSAPQTAGHDAATSGPSSPPSPTAPAAPEPKNASSALQASLQTQPQAQLLPNRMDRKCDFGGTSFKTWLRAGRPEQGAIGTFD